MTGPTASRLLRFLHGTLGLKEYLSAPGDGRLRPRISARNLLWALLAGQVLREWTNRGVESLVRLSGRGLGIHRKFGDDAIAYFMQRLSPDRTREALGDILRWAKRAKVFARARFVGLAIDGTGAGKFSERHCRLCCPVRGEDGEIQRYVHHVCMISVVGVELTLPFDVEPYGPGVGESRASEQLLTRAVQRLGARFADYVVADAEMARAPFLHTAGDLGLHVVVRLKGNLPELREQAERRFAHKKPDRVVRWGDDRVELWDADDFDPWEKLRWKTVRVIRYRQHKPDGSSVDAYWLTDFPKKEASSVELFEMAKSRWEIENQGFNDSKNRHGLEHVRRHDPNSLLVGWLLIALALTIERLFRRTLHRGFHAPLTAIELVRLLRNNLGRFRCNLARPVAADTS